LNLRLSAGAFSLDYDDTINDVDYSFNVDLLTFPVLLDWYLFSDAFHLSAGIIVNETDVDFDARSSIPIKVGDDTYTPAQAGTLYGDVSFDRVAPYLGIGWGNPFREGKWGLLCDLGVVYLGSPDVSLSANGTLASNPTFQADLAKEEHDIEDKADNYRFYPVLSLSLYVRF
jgi:hypothetical protein